MLLETCSNTVPGALRVEQTSPEAQPLSQQLHERKPCRSSAGITWRWASPRESVARSPGIVPENATDHAERRQAPPAIPAPRVAPVSR